MSGPGFNPYHPPKCGCRKCVTRHAGEGLFEQHRREGAGRSSIKRSHRAEGRNFVD